MAAAPLANLAASSLLLTMLCSYCYYARQTELSLFYVYNIAAFGVASVSFWRLPSPYKILEILVSCLLDYLFLVLWFRDAHTLSPVFMLINITYIHFPFLFVLGRKNLLVLIIFVLLTASLILHYDLTKKTMAGGDRIRGPFVMILLTARSFLVGRLAEYFSLERFVNLFVFSLADGLMNYRSLGKELQYIGGGFDRPKMLALVGLLSYVLLFLLCRFANNLDLRVLIYFNIQASLVVGLFFMAQYDKFRVWMFSEYRLLPFLLCIQLFNTLQISLLIPASKSLQFDLAAPGPEAIEDDARIDNENEDAQAEPAAVENDAE